MYVFEILGSYDNLTQRFETYGISLMTLSVCPFLYKSSTTRMEDILVVRVYPGKPCKQLSYMYSCMSNMTMLWSTMPCAVKPVLKTSPLVTRMCPPLPQDRWSLVTVSVILTRSFCQNSGLSRHQVVVVSQDRFQCTVVPLFYNPLF